MENKNSSLKHQESTVPVTDEKNLMESYKSVIDVYKTGLDDLVNVNSLFTMAVFVGLTFATPGQLKSLETLEYCHVGNSEAKKLVLCEVMSFSCFLMSSLVAKSLKLSLQMKLRTSFDLDGRLRLTKWLMLVMSVCGSFLGYLFLMVAMIYVVQLRLGRLSCLSPYAATTLALMISVISIAMVVYVSVVVTALRKTLHLGHGDGNSKA